MISLEEIKKEYSDIVNKLSDPEVVSDWKKAEELSIKKSSLQPTIDVNNKLEEINRNIADNESVIEDNSEEELVLMAKEELESLVIEKEKTEKELKKLLNKDDSIEENELIMEIRAGAGGDEASLFAADLFRMYSKYAESNDWNFELMDSHENEVGGFKQIVFQIKGLEAYSKLKYEAGVHRVQRTPETEKMGRIHTSTVSVAVMPKPKETAIEVKTEDLKIDTYRASGPGGQNVNKRDTAIRVTHIPTGTVVTCQSERSQLQNKESALNILRAKLLEEKKEKERRENVEQRKEQIGTGDRSEKIRTYNFPQDRITDHRIGESWHGIEKILEGDLEPIIESLNNSEELN
jgi:peptide chain release factor 1